MKLIFLEEQLTIIDLLGVLGKKGSQARNEASKVLRKLSHGGKNETINPITRIRKINLNGLNFYVQDSTIPQAGYVGLTWKTPFGNIDDDDVRPGEVKKFRLDYFPFDEDEGEILHKLGSKLVQDNCIDITIITNELFQQQRLE